MPLENLKNGVTIQETESKELMLKRIQRNTEGKVGISLVSRQSPINEGI